ncbi:MAG: stage III sporulation protein AA [Dethiobacter sp.]|nr:stage III sporulation protein AA [Dethiobacter sp.]
MGVEQMARACWKSQILPFLPAPLPALVLGLEEETLDRVEEIRLRADKPLVVHSGQAWHIFDGQRNAAHIVSREEINGVLMLATEHSLYARDEELRRGYLSLPGGHRAGFAGRTVLAGGAVKLLRDICAVNIRIAREVKGAARGLLANLYNTAEKRVRHTLIISAPQAGKTTLLRDLARMFADGDQNSGRPAFKVGIVDERSEIAGCFAGKPQLDVGLHSDVLDGCPKSEGMMMLVRSMSPQLVVTDELGRPEDVRAVEEVMNSGAVLLASAHSGTVSDLFRRPSLACLLERRLFERIVLLSCKNGPGTVEAVLTAAEVLLAGRKDG